MDFTLHEPTETHVAQICTIWDVGWHSAHADIVPPRLRALRTTDSFLERVVAYLSQTVIAISGDQVLGFCMVKDDELYQLFVSEQARGTGVASGDIAKSW